MGSWPSACFGGHVFDIFVSSEIFHLFLFLIRIARHFIALDLSCGGFCLLLPPVSTNWRAGASWRLLLLVPSFWTPISPVQWETGRDLCFIWQFAAAWASVCCWERLMKAKQTWTAYSTICGLCMRTLRSAQLGMATCNLSLNGPYSGVSGRWRPVPRGPQEAASASWHGGGTSDPGLVLVWLVQTPVSMTGCNVSCWDGILGSCPCGIRTPAPFHPPGSWMMSDDLCELKMGVSLLLLTGQWLSLHVSLQGKSY